MFMENRTNVLNDLHRSSLTQMIFEKKVLVEVSHIMCLPLSALNLKECLNTNSEVLSYQINTSETLVWHFQWELSII